MSRAANVQQPNRRASASLSKQSALVAKVPSAKRRRMSTNSMVTNSSPSSSTTSCVVLCAESCSSTLWAISAQIASISAMRNASILLSRNASAGPMRRAILTKLRSIIRYHIVLSRITTSEPIGVVTAATCYPWAGRMLKDAEVRKCRPVSVHM